MEAGAPRPEIWGHAALKQLSLDAYMSGPKVMRGAYHQIGYHIGDQLFSAGLGRRYKRNLHKPDVAPFPDKLVTQDWTHVIIAGQNSYWKA